MRVKTKGTWVRVGKIDKEQKKTYIIHMLQEISKDITSKRQEHEVTKEIIQKGGA